MINRAPAASELPAQHTKELQGAGSSLLTAKTPSRGTNSHFMFAIAVV
jgi:hypothetical protein